MGSSHENDDHFTESLNRIIRQVADRNPATEFRIDEQDLLDYLAGRAEKEVTESIQSSLASSSELRRDLVEIGNDLDRLQEVADMCVEINETTRPATDRSTILGENQASPWPERTPPAPENPLQGLIDFFRSLFLKPAFAYALTFALMAYPTYRFFMPGESDAPMLSDTRLVYLDAGDIRVRGEEDPGTIITLGPEDHPVLTLGLYAVEPFRRNQRYSLEIVNNGNTVWTEERVIQVVDPAEPTRIDFQLNTRALEAGTVIIRIRPHEEDDSASPRTEEFMFQLEKAS